MDSDEKLQRLALRFLEDMLKSDYESATMRLDQKMRKLLSIKRLHQTWMNEIRGAGGFIEPTDIKSMKKDDVTVIIIRCHFEEKVLDMYLVFNNQDEISGMNFMPVEVAYKPPEYVNQDSFKEIEVEVGEGDWVLPGTLTLPLKPGQTPGVVLVHGSGPNDRDETIGPNKFFRDIAWGLATQGFAVLRYEKRTREYGQKFSQEQLMNFTIEDEVTNDAVKAVELMQRQPDISEVYLLGHSLGGYLAPQICSEISVDGLIIMAGPTRPLEDFILEQYTYLYSLDDISEDQENELETLKKQVMRVKDPQLDSNISPSELPLGLPHKYWLSLRGYDPLKAVKKLKIPILVLQGGRDYQVLPEKDFENWKDLLVENPNATLKLFPLLNHLFIAGKGQCTPQEYFIEDKHVDVDVIMTISKWLED